MAKILDGGYNFCLNPFEQEIVGHFFTLILLQGEREKSTQMLRQIKNFQEKIFRIPWKILIRCLLVHIKAETILSLKRCRLETGLQ